MFAIALWDRVEQTLYLVRDRLGKKPLYYGRFGATYLFGSELKALHAHPDCRAEIDQDVLALYVRFGYVPEHHSIFCGINKLPPAHFAVFRKGQPVQVKPFWQVREVVESGVANRAEFSESEATDQLE